MLILLILLFSILLLNDNKLNRYEYELKELRVRNQPLYQYSQNLKKENSDLVQKLNKSKKDNLNFLFIENSVIKIFVNSKCTNGHALMYFSEESIFILCIWHTIRGVKHYRVKGLHDIDFIENGLKVGENKDYKKLLSLRISNEWYLLKPADALFPKVNDLIKNYLERGSNIQDLEDSYFFKYMD